MKRIGRTLPPAASPLLLADLAAGMQGIRAGARETERLRAELRTFFGVRHCFLTSSGKAALVLILRALRKAHPERDRVIVPAFTCYSVPSAISRAGLQMDPCDMDPDSLDFDYTCLAELLGCQDEPGERRRKQEKILAILPTHLYGIPSDVQRLKKMLTDPEITVVEDAAQSMGEACGGALQGTRGDVGFFSLGRGKALTTGEGGIILTNRDSVAEQLHSVMQTLPSYSSGSVLKLGLMTGLMNIFIHPALFWLPASLPFLRLGETIYDPDFLIRKMSSFQAGLAVNWRKRLSLLQRARRNSVGAWLDVLPERYLSHLKPYRHNLPACIRLPIRIEDRELADSIYRESELRGWGIMFSYPGPVNSLPPMSETTANRNFPGAGRLCREILTLPVHPFVTGRDIQHISTVLCGKTLAPSVARSATGRE